MGSQGICTTSDGGNGSSVAILRLPVAGGHRKAWCYVLYLAAERVQSFFKVSAGSATNANTTRAKVGKTSTYSRAAISKTPYTHPSHLTTHSSSSQSPTDSSFFCCSIIPVRLPPPFSKVDLAFDGTVPTLPRRIRRRSYITPYRPQKGWLPFELLTL